MLKIRLSISLNQAGIQGDGLVNFLWWYGEKKCAGTSLVIQWLRCPPYTAGVAGSIPGQGTKIPHATWCGKKKKKKKCNNKKYAHTLSA